VSSGDEPLLIAGVATHTLEILEAQPDIDVIFVAGRRRQRLCGCVSGGKGDQPAHPGDRRGGDRGAGRFPELASAQMSAPRR
jgi:hypothetical protein